MELKEYQLKVIERLDTYLRTLKEKKEEVQAFVEFQRERGKEVKPENFAEKTWDELNLQRLLPTYRDKQGHEREAPYISRHDGMDRTIPNICFKVPTAGGKTLLATVAVDRIKNDYFEQQTGFVLWVVPTDSIYKQTWKALANREHPYRQMLERASGGRVKVLEKLDSFTPQDVQDHLCVMLLMLQSAGRQSKETLKMFRDSGKFTSFFPETDDYQANEALLKAVPNLDLNSMLETHNVIEGISIKHSLGNALKLIRPVVVIDEGHKAYSDIARDTINLHFNPSFILELSATPNNKAKRASNILVDISGTALKDEQMIKLPINVFNFDKADWKYCLTQSHGELLKLQNNADKLQQTDGRYIRPLMVIRVDRTGKDMRDGIHVHALDARDYLIDHLGVKPEEIRIKSSEVDELSDEDLFDSLCQVRYIITKDALREGWDCSFAYVLSILSKTTAMTALTQMIGRVLRQPDARLTSVEELNQCYVFCFDQEVQNAVESVRKGLEEEGMGDLSSEVKDRTHDDAIVKRVKIQRKEQFRGYKVFLPRVLHKKGATFCPLDYEQDVLAELDWNSFSFTQEFTPDDHDRLQRTITKLNLREKDGQLDILDQLIQKEELTDDTSLDYGFMVRQIMEVIPNPWQAARILDEALETLKDKVSLSKLFTNRLFLLKEIKDDLSKKVHSACEKVFRNKLTNGDIIFNLLASPNEILNWELAELLELTVKDDDHIFKTRSGEDVEKCLFEKVYQRDLNGLERDVAWYLDGEDSIYWWHRLVAKQDYHLQGWQRNKVYPDFLACLKELENGTKQFIVLETKGKHLKGNDDTEYKARLFDLLTEHYNSALEAGTLELAHSTSDKIQFRMLMEETWRPQLSGIFNDKTLVK